MLRSDRQFHRLLDIPPANCEKDLVEAMHLDPIRVGFISHNSKFFYRKYTIKKRSGGLRVIEAPNKELKAIQTWILRNILDRLHCSPNATAYIKGHTLVSNVEPHRFNRYFLCVDIENYFPSIGIGKVVKFFELLGYPSKVAFFLSLLCTTDSHLPQGAVTSPSLSNLTSSPMDRRIVGLSSRRNIVYSRYADDMTFSSNNPNYLPKLLRPLGRILLSEGFRLNLDKIRFLGPDVSCRITGLTKDSSTPQFSIGTRKKRQMRSLMYHAFADEVFDPLYPSIESLEGWLSYLRSVDMNSYASMRKYWLSLKNRYGDGSK